ncbi:MAG: DUF5688 family protein [Lachnospiraceae bacterium]|nr:DUF5688 family protein [Lachnospiraceae bacterium]
MNYSQFLEMITKEVRGRIDPQASIHISRIQKMNQPTEDGMTILLPGENTAPAIYLDSFYQEYLDGASLPVLAEKILTFHTENRRTGICDLSFYQEFEQARKRLVCRLVNYEMNQQLLEHIPHRRFLDLAIVYYYEIEANDSEFEHSSILVRNTHMKMWDVDVSQLHAIAASNTRVLLPHLIGTIDMLGDITQIPLPPRDPDAPRIYILTNKQLCYGAVNIIYDDILRSLSDKFGGDFFVLPSSIHECLILPICSWNDKDPQKLQSIVSEINQKYVPTEEILGDNIYRYSRTMGTLCLVSCAQVIL